MCCFASYNERLLFVYRQWKQPLCLLSKERQFRGGIGYLGHSWRGVCGAVWDMFMWKDTQCSCCCCCCYCWSLLYNVIFRSRGDSLRSHKILLAWLAFHGAFLNICQSGVFTTLFDCYMAGATWNCCHLSAVFVCKFCVNFVKRCKFWDGSVARQLAETDNDLSQSEHAYEAINV